MRIRFAALLVVFLLQSAPGWGATAATAVDSDGVEDVEDVQVVDVGDVGAAAETKLSFVQILGRNHAAVVHLPIGFLFALCLVEAVRLARKKSNLDSAGKLLSVAAVLSFIPAAVTGLLRSKELYSETPAPHIFFEHRNLMIAAAAVLLVATVLRLVQKEFLTGKKRVLYLVLLAASLALVVVGAHHGGMLVYGEQFLPY